MTSLNFIRQTVATLNQGTLSSEQLFTQMAQRVAEQNPIINAVNAVHYETALAEARQFDQAKLTGANYPFAGLPLLVKAIFCVRDQISSAASNLLADYKSPFDAHVISRSRQAGWVIAGHCNCDEFAMGSSNEHSIYGPVKNPWDTHRVAGGSSGGSAAAVAAGWVLAALGTDTGGSVRQPAAYCGIVGLKPTYGAISRYGMIAYASSLDQAGVFARTAADAGDVLQHIMGFDPRDSTSAAITPGNVCARMEHKLDNLVIGVPSELFPEGMDHELKHQVENANSQLARLGATIKKVSLPNMRLAIAAYYVLAMAEASSNLSRYDGVRYGTRATEFSDLADFYSQNRGQGFGQEVKRRILMGSYVLSHGYYDAYYLKAQKIRRLICDDFARAFAECDVLVGPTTPTPAFKLGEKNEDPTAMYRDDVCTVAVNLAGLPAASIPCGYVMADQARLPVGLQLIAPHFGEDKLIQVGHQYQLATEWHNERPQKFREV